MAHNHSHGHSHSDTNSYNKAFAIGIGLNIVFVAVEVFYGLIATLRHCWLMPDTMQVMYLVWCLPGLLHGCQPKKPTKKRFTYGFEETTILISLNALLFGAVIAIG